MKILTIGFFILDDYAGINHRAQNYGSFGKALECGESTRCCNEKYRQA